MVDSFLGLWRGHRLAGISTVHRHCIASFERRQARDPCHAREHAVLSPHANRRQPSPRLCSIHLLSPHQAVHGPFGLGPPSRRRSPPPEVLSLQAATLLEPSAASHSHAFLSPHGRRGCRVAKGIVRHSSCWRGSTIPNRSITQVQAILELPKRPIEHQRHGKRSPRTMNHNSYVMNRKITDTKMKHAGSNVMTP
jgi:hypothetical protein